MRLLGLGLWSCDRMLMIPAAYSAGSRSDAFYFYMGTFLMGVKVGVIGVEWVLVVKDAFYIVGHLL